MVNAQEDYFTLNLKSSGIYFEEDLTERKIRQDILSLVNADVAARYKIIPVELKDDALILVTNSSDSFKAINQIAAAIGKKVKILFGDEDNVNAALLEYYNFSGSYKLLQHNYESDIDIDVATPLKRLVNDMLQDAANKHASDIHLLPTASGMNVHFRINGHLVDLSEAYRIHEAETLLMVNIIKGMDTSRNADASTMNMPNRGAFSIRRGDINIDIRLSTVPIGSSIGPQKVNLRLLPQKQQKIKLDELGYPPEDLKKIRTMLYKSATGLFINSGPTGAGKTTSLYAQMYYVLETLQEPLNIMTIENPIEIKEENFCQVQVREAPQENLNLTPRKILKVGLRSDPDMFLYGEIRDKDDAIVAIEASSTGHRVFTTVHSSNALKTITRLLDLEVSRMSLLAELKMIISQRLLGVLCPSCSRPHILTDKEKEILSEKEIKMLTAEGTVLRERGSIEAQKKCPAKCLYGFAGRIAVAEIIEFNNHLRDALLRESRFDDVARVLNEHGFVSMWDKGLKLVSKGVVELSELIHVIGKED